MFTRLLGAVCAAHARLAAGGRDRGDVPGWVMITLMTAGLVVLLTGLATAAFGNIFDKAVKSVCSSC
ncbi:MAG TPA: hypothetical protein VNG13_03965 [Mycobacteriales bacterium]|nr:hypothetical protein [Mycobacteriales bacterium]